MPPSRICLLGASPNTGNLGVSALCFSALRGLYRTLEEPQVTVFDDSDGAGTFIFEADGRQHSVQRCGAYQWRRIWRSESLLNIQWSSRFGGMGNPGARAIAKCSLALDASGGDSFADLYGRHRFNTVTILKRTVLAQGKPLVLLPQTYGPFVDVKRANAAAQILRHTTMAWARDEASYERLRDLLGRHFDPDRHRCGVDMAFALETLPPADKSAALIREFLAERTSAPIVGINVSGLIYNDPEEARRRYGLKADYRKVVTELVQRLLKESDCRIILVPHVVTPPGHYESDVEACAKVAEACASRDRVVVLPALDDPRHVKWVIGQTDWFCGTRMHSAIAALSSGVPTAALAYSLKTRGVFETCGQREQVAELRSRGTEETVEQLMDSWKKREEARCSLRETMPGVIAQAERQMELIMQLGLSRENQRESGGVTYGRP